MKHFYSHLVEIESVTVRLEGLDLTEGQKVHLAALVDSTIHHTVLEMILSKLSPEDRRVFLTRLKDDPGDKKLMEFLNSKADNIEEEIRAVVKKLKEELHKDMQEAKKGGKHD